MAKKLVLFALHAPRDGEWSFTNYSDDEGNLVSLSIGQRPNGSEIPYTLSFPKGARIVSLPANKKDRNGNSIVEYIRNSPFCKDSKLCEGEGMFFEINPRKDADVMLEEAAEQNRATSYALDVSGEALKDLAVYMGEFSDDENIQRSVVYQFARRAPRNFNELSKSPEVSHTALFRKLLNKGVIKKIGFNHVADLDQQRVNIGPTEKNCIEKNRHRQKTSQSLRSEV